MDWIPKGPPSGTLTIKPKERCPPKFVTKIEGNAVEEGVKVFFEGIVDAQPQPKFNWYFNDEPIVPGSFDSEIYNPLVSNLNSKISFGMWNVCLGQVMQKQYFKRKFDCYLIRDDKIFTEIFIYWNFSGAKRHLVLVGILQEKRHLYFPLVLKV